MEQKYGMDIPESDDRGDPEKSMVLQTCERITDNLAAKRSMFDGTDSAGLNELIAQAQVELMERDKDWPGQMDRPDLAALGDEITQACHSAHPNGSPF